MAPKVNYFYKVYIGFPYVFSLFVFRYYLFFIKNVVRVVHRASKVKKPNINDNNKINSRS